MLSVVDHAIEINFGQLGLGGVSQAGLSLAQYWSEMIQGDGYYELDVNPVSGPEQVFHFYRLLGDIDGRGVVDNTDVNEITSALGQTGLALAPDVNGNGIVDVTDKARRRSKSNNRRARPRVVAGRLTTGLARPCCRESSSPGPARPAEASRDTSGRISRDRYNLMGSCSVPVRMPTPWRPFSCRYECRWLRLRLRQCFRARPMHQLC